MLDRDSAALVDPDWDEKEKAEEWLAKISEGAEREALCFSF